MGFSRTQTIDIALTVDQVWNVLTNASAWVQFDDQLQHFTPVEMAGSRLQVGDKVKVVPKVLVRGFIHAATAPPARIITADAQREIAWRQDQPGGFTQQRWVLAATDHGTELTRHTEVVGPLAAPLGIALAEPLTGDLGAVGARMVQMAAPAPAASLPLTIIAGGSGYLGVRLATRLLAAGQRVMVLTRTPTSGAPYPQTQWNVDDLAALHELLLDDAGVNIVNLTGRRIGATFTDKEVDALAASRLGPAEALRSAVASARAQGGAVHRWIQGSAIPLWDAKSTKEFTESTAPTADLDGPHGMGQLVADWEASAPEEAIIVRTAIVLGQQAQVTMGLSAMALSKTRPSIDGYLPWIHEDDWVGLIEHLLAVANPPKIVVAVAPQQTRRSEVLHALAPAWGTRNLPLPSRLLTMGLKAVRMEPGLLLGSTKARSEVMEDLGYVFHYPTIGQAADALRL